MKTLSFYIFTPKTSMNKTYKIFMGTLLLLQLGTTAVTQNAEAADPFQRFYNESCVPEAQNAGFTEAEAKQGCGCTINALRNKYPTPTFTTLYNQYESGDKAAKQTLTRHGQTCFEGIVESIIYEED